MSQPNQSSWTATPGADPGVDVLLVDGRVARIRPVRADDLPRLVALHDGVGDESIRRRFFTLNRSMGRSYAEHLCSGGPDILALAALVGDELLAVASAEPEGEGRAEVAFLVADAARGLGLGTLLVEHLAAAARERHLHTFTAEVLLDNAPMLRVFADAGFDARHTTDRGVQSLVLDTAATARAVAAADLRESRAEARSLAPLLYPHSVAVVGVRGDGTGVGSALVDSILEGGFTGELYVVHPSLPRRAGVTVVPAFAAIPGGVDLALIAVPAAMVLETATAAAEAGVRAAVVVSSGFAELGEGGRALQHELVRVARRHSMRVVGPNCLGVLCADPSVRLQALFAGTPPEPGGLAIASQSGGVGVALLEAARRRGVGVSSFVSLGNKADVSGNDLLAAWLEDDHVTAAALYLESFGNARKFARLARRFSERKPLLAVVGGRSAGGRRAGTSHTAAAAAPSVGVGALFRQAGVIGCAGLDEIIETAHLLAGQPLPAGPRLAVVGNAGGLGILASDAASEAGLVVPEFSAALRRRLGQHASGTTAVANPVDLGAVPGPEAMLAVTRAVLTSGEVDALLVVLVATRASEVGGFLAALDAERPVDVPVLVVALGDVGEVPVGFTRFGSVDAAVASLGRVATYAAWREASGSEEPPAEPAGDPVLDVPLGADAAPRWLTVDEGRALLARVGVDTAAGEVVRGVDGAVTAAEARGYPVVLKAADPDVVHKTDRGLVALELQHGEAVRAAAELMVAELGDPQAALLVQPQLEAGVEMAVGMVRDPAFGPLVMVAAGGVTTDVLADRAFLMPPVAERDAVRALRSLRVWSLLAGYRGAAPVDVTALARVVVAVGDLALRAPELAELDLNPVLCGPTGATPVDVKARVAAPVGPADAGVPRQLRSPV